MYGKVFTSIWDGSLYGKLEASATLMALVTLCNAQGVVDMTIEAISGRTGWPIDFIMKGIEDLERPDPRSRTPDEDGRRLAKIDTHRDWGWLIVNYIKYREKKDVDIEREQTKERVRRFRSRVTARNGSNGHVTVGNGLKRQAEAEAEAFKKEPPSPPEGLDPKAWELWSGYKKPKPHSVHYAMKNLAVLGPRQLEAVEYSIGNGYRGLYLPKDAPRKRPEWE